MNLDIKHRFQHSESVMKYKIIGKENFLSEIKKLNIGANIDLLQEALQFAASAHELQKRKSGEEYIIHPINVAYILAEMKLDSACVASALLHDVLEDTDFSEQDLEDKFGAEITVLVSGVTKIESFQYRAKPEEKQAENFRKLLISLTKDIRIILIKLADRLHNMRTLEYMMDKQKQRIARETMDIYAPLANRFGIAGINRELEDLSFKWLFPDEYKKLAKLVLIKKDERDLMIQSAVSDIEKVMKNNDISGTVNGRSKHFYSIFHKHRRKNVSYDDILDLAAIRIIVDSVSDCYKVLGVIQTEFIPLESSRKDYIARPKPNNYQSLHLVAENVEGQRFEFQIRTKEMHLIAEEGIAAHWLYKGQESKEQIQEEFEGQLFRIRNFLNDQKDSENFLDSLKMNLHPDIIVVLSPQNDYVKLRKHSSPIDYAFKVHTDVGFHCKGAFVNGKIVPLRSRLYSGDVVQILTSPQAKPSKDWIKFLTSPKARQKIRSYFKKLELQDFIDTGKELFFKRARKIHLKARTDEEISEIARNFRISDARSFFAALGKNEITFDVIKEVLKEKEFVEAPQIIQDELELKRKKSDGIIIEEITDILLRYAKCCNPVPGDKIIGYVTRGKGITIHKTNCTNTGFFNQIKKEPERKVNVRWNYRDEKK
jgi:GTP diphosphokinase / guanosine-3',5'-bis(diphosphate) 3'-diphosphatase